MTPRKFVEYPEDYGPWDERTREMKRRRMAERVDKDYDKDTMIPVPSIAALEARVAELVKRGNAMADALGAMDWEGDPVAAWREVVPEEGT